jgi:hypothetical protein
MKMEEHKELFEQLTTIELLVDGSYVEEEKVFDCSGTDINPNKAAGSLDAVFSNLGPRFDTSDIIVETSGQKVIVMSSMDVEDKAGRDVDTLSRVVSITLGSVIFMGAITRPEMTEEICRMAMMKASEHKDENDGGDDGRENGE